MNNDLKKCRRKPQAKSCRPLTVKTGAQSQASSCGICVKRSGTGTGFSLCTSVFPRHYHATRASYSSSSTCCSYQKDKRAKRGDLPKSKRAKRGDLPKSKRAKRGDLPKSKRAKRGDLPKSKGAKRGDLPKSILCEIGEH